MTQQEFERLVEYLTAVPIFRKQLPRSELPRVAKALKETIWRPGAFLTRRGDVGRAFHIIKSGRAAVLLPGPHNEEEESAVLYAMDYVGGHNLVERRPNAATIVAKGPEPLVTLTMEKADFEGLGLHRLMTFPTRPAIYDGARGDKIGRELDVNGGCAVGEDRHAKTPLSEEELEFISTAVMSNQYLRLAFGDEVCTEKVRAFARGAQRRRVPAGADIAKSGEVLQELYVIRSGTFSLIFGGSLDELKSVEERVGHLTKVRRWLRMKEQLVHELTALQGRKRPAPGGRSAFSVRVARAERLEEELMRPSGSARTSREKHASEGAIKAPSSPFAVGQRVARVIVGDLLVREVGTVVEVIRHGRDGEVLVEFTQPPRKERIEVRELRPAPSSAPLALMTRGMCYGELSLLYNTHLVTTLRAIDDAEVYVLSRRGFKEAFSRQSPSLEDHIKLLDDVELLTPLVRSERWALARSACGVFEFGPGEAVVRQGEPLPEHDFLYVIKSGSCVVKQESPVDGEVLERQLSTLRTPACFGERDIFLKLEKAEATVQAGPEGVAVLLIHGDILRQFMANMDLGRMADDVAEYLRVAPRGREASCIPFSELSFVRILGEGGFGSVFLVRDSQGSEYALKRLSKGFIVKAQVQRQVVLEREMMTMVDSDFIVRLFQTYKDADYVYMLLECCSGGHLFDAVNAAKVGGPTMSPSSVMFYIASVTFALEHLHDRRIAFRDLKAENVLLDASGYVKLCDMGFAKFVVDKTYTLLGTPEYMAPETIDTPHAHDHMVDWWALGVLTFELFTSQIPWIDAMGVSPRDPVRRMLAIRDSHDDGIPERLIPRAQAHARDFINGLLVINPRKRLGSAGAASVRRHPWFVSNAFDFDALFRRAMPAPEPPHDASGETEAVSFSSDGLHADSSLFAPAVDICSDWDSEF